MNKKVNKERRKGKKIVDASESCRRKMYLLPESAMSPLWLISTFKKYSDETLLRQSPNIDGMLTYEGTHIQHEI